MGDHASNGVAKKGIAKRWCFKNRTKNNAVIPRRPCSRFERRGRKETVPDKQVPQTRASKPRGTVGSEQEGLAFGYSAGTPRLKHRSWSPLRHPQHNERHRKHGPKLQTDVYCSVNDAGRLRYYRKVLFQETGENNCVPVRKMECIVVYSRISLPFRNAAVSIRIRRIYIYTSYSSLVLGMRRWPSHHQS